MSRVVHDDGCERLIAQPHNRPPLACSCGLEREIDERRGVTAHFASKADESECFADYPEVARTTILGDVDCPYCLASLARRGIAP